jgi:hypothetical protein
MIISVQEEERPSNDSCDGATSLVTLPVAKSGTTAGAFPDFDLETCGIPAVSRGVWFSYVGKGNDVRASVSQVDFNSKIAVFEGNCNSLVCIGSNDGPFVVTSSLIFAAKAGKTYHILLSGAKGFDDAGKFNLEITVRAMHSSCIFVFCD